MLVVVYLKVTGLELAGGGDGLVGKARAGVAYRRADAGKKLACTEGLCYIVVCTEVKCLHLVTLVCTGGNDDYRQQRPLTHRFYYLEPVNVRQTEIEHNKVGAVGGYHGIGLRPGACDDDIVVVRNEYRAQEVCDTSFVLNYEDLVSDIHSSVSSGSNGSVNVNTAPPVGLLSADILPPWAVIMDLHTARPMPLNLLLSGLVPSFETS